MKGNWTGGWRIPSEEELAKRKRLRELRLGRREKAVAILATLKKADAVTIVAGFLNCSQRKAREWFEEVTP